MDIKANMVIWRSVLMCNSVCESDGDDDGGGYV